MPQAKGVNHIRVTAGVGGTTTVLAGRVGQRLSLLLQCETEAVRVTFDGTTASATNGILLNPGDSVSWGFEDGVPSEATIKAYSAGGTGVVNGIETYLG